MKKKIDIKITDHMTISGSVVWLFGLALIVFIVGGSLFIVKELMYW